VLAAAAGRSNAEIVRVFGITAKTVRKWALLMACIRTFDGLY